MTDLAIIIVSYNARADLDRCLDSLHAAPPITPHDILVVDNASSDGSPSMVRERWPNVRVIDAGDNLGFAAANNIGFRHSASEFVLLLNSDTLVPPGAIDALVADLRAHPNVGIVGPRLLDAEGQPEISWGPMIGPWNEMRQKLLGRLYARGVRPVRRWVDAAVRRARRVDWVSGACLLVRRRDAEAVGLLDDRFFLYTEDVDFCAAVRGLGREVRFSPNAEIVHLRGRSRAHAPVKANAAYRRSHLAFYDKHHPRWAPILRAYLAIRGQLPAPASPSRRVEDTNVKST